MPEDIKSLTKKCTDLEKRLKLAEAKIKALADNMTNARDIEKFMDVVSQGQTDLKKRTQRIDELASKRVEGFQKQADKKYAQIVKDMQKSGKEYARETDLTVIKVRLTTVEAMAKVALSK